MATTQEIIAQNNTNAPQMATSNPQANVGNVQPGIAPVTIPVQIQPVVQQTQQQPAQTQLTQVQQPQVQQAQMQPAQQTPNVVQNITQAKQMQYSFPAVTIPSESVIDGASSYKSQYSDAINQIANSILNMRFSYNPEEDDLLQQATQYVTQNTYESMNSKGILNSSMTAERVAKIVGDLIPQYEKMARDEFEASFSRMINMANLIMNMDDRSFTIWRDARDQRWKEQEAEYEKKQREIQNAWNKVDQLGYVDNESALILNIPAGTLSKDARESKEKFEREVEEWNRRHEIETATEKELMQLKLELEDNMQARQEARQQEYEKELLKYKSELSVDEYNTKSQIDATSQSSSSSSKGLVSLSNYDAIIKNRFATKQNGQYVVTDPSSLINYLKQEYESGRLSETDALTLLAKYNLNGMTESSRSTTQATTRKPYLIISTGESGYGAAY